MLNDTERISLPHRILMQETYSKISKCFDLGVVCDFGCGSGHFLKLMSDRGLSVVGIEITEESRKYASSLNLRVFKEPVSGMQIDTILFLHSFEHLAPDVLLKTLDWVKLSNCRRVIISVPNLSGIGYNLFGLSNAFHDPVNHPAIFSQKGLDVAFQSIGFVRNSSFRIWTYSIFGLLQSSLNIVFKSKNEFYLRTKRAKKIPSKFMQLVQVTLVLLLIPTVLPLCMTLLLVRKADFVLNCEYIRDNLKII
jgi:SAM-dependent methyltransferase